MIVQWGITLKIKHIFFPFFHHQVKGIGDGLGHVHQTLKKSDQCLVVLITRRL